jgi:hypothetical protein
MEVIDGQKFRLALGEPFPGGAALALWTMTITTSNGELTITCLMGKFCNGELATVWSAAKLKTDAFAPHYGLALSKAMSLSGGRKEPLRRCGGTTASMASSFSVGSPRV